jgi:hypothetical protein
MAGKKRTSIKLTEFEDIEFLHKLQDVADDDGYATSAELAVELKIDNDCPARNVGSRMAWLKRYGVVELHPKKGWRLTKIGDALVNGELNSYQRKSLSSMPEEQLLALTRQVSSRFQGAGDSAAQMMRRQFRYGMAQRRK